MAVYAWGFGKLGQLGRGDFKSSNLPARINKIYNKDRPIQIATGGLFTVILTQKGDLFACGCGKHGRLGSRSEEDTASLVQIIPGKDTKIAQVSGGSWHTCAITFLGRLYSWGYNLKHNVLGRECITEQDWLTPAVVPSLMSIKVSQVSCGHNFTLICTQDGEAYSWGCGRFGVLGHGDESCTLEPRKIEALDRIHIKTVNAGYAHCGIISIDGRLYMFGKGCDGALGFGPLSLANSTEPTWLLDMISVQFEAVSCSVGEHRGHTLALSIKGHVYSWGSNHKGKLGHGDQEPRWFPTRIPQDSFDTDPVIAIAAGGMHSGAVTKTGNAYTWGSGKDGRLGHPEADVKGKTNSYYVSKPKLVESLPEKQKVLDIRCSQYHTVVRLEQA